MRLPRITATVVATMMAFCAVASDAVVRVTVASLRASSSHAAELETQALMGTPVTYAGEETDEWRKVTLPTGYLAWIPKSAITKADGWNRCNRCIVTAPVPVYLTADTLPAGPRNVVTDLVFGCVLRDTGVRAGAFVRLATPDGREGWVRSADVSDFSSFASVAPSAQAVLDYAGMMRGTTYLWGANSAKFVDCSGLTSICYMMAGLQLPRNASQQARIGVAVDARDRTKWLPGDLIFFANKSGRVNHVGIKWYGDSIIHASGLVRVNSLDPASPAYIGRKVHSVRRIIGAPEAEALRLLNIGDWFHQ